MTSRYEYLNDAEESFRAAFQGKQAAIWTALPCVVKAVDLTKMTVQVQPTIQIQQTLEDGSTININLPLLGDVPIVFPSAGGFTITFPVAVGDEVLVVFSSRCIDAWWQSGGINPQSELRMHDLSDGFAIPGPKSQPHVVSGISSTNLQIRNNAGTTYVEIDSSGKIKLVSPSEIDITAPAIKLTGAVNIVGSLVVSTTIVATGNITGAILTGASIATSGGGGASIAGAIVAASVTAGGISLTGHLHPVSTAPGTTGAPI